MTNVGQEVGLSRTGVEAGEEVSSKRRFTEMSKPSHWIDLHNVRKLSSKLKAKLMVPESVVVPKANVGVEIIIVSDDDGDDDNEVVGDTLDTVVAETDDKIYSATVGMSGFILEACVMQWKVAALKVTRKINCPMSNKVEMREVSSLFKHTKAKGSRTKRRPEMVTCEGSKLEVIP
nr:hypothetical protein [Tanacetum cinerariifolium]